MGKKKLYRRWRRRFLAALAESQRLLTQCLRAGTSDDVHDLRVTLRRGRMLALVGATVLGKMQAGHFRQWALKAATCLGKLRDYDVTQEWLKTHTKSPKRDRILQQNRNRLWLATRPKLAAFSTMRWKQLRQSNAFKVRPRKLRKKFRNEGARLRRALVQDAGRFDDLGEHALHEFRRGLRRLRYLRELALSRREQKTDRKLAQLIVFQEALGEMLNRAVVREFFEGQPTYKSNRKTVRLARGQQRQWLEKARKQLPIFLRQEAD